MIDMKCPSCGAGGRIPREKVNTRLVCKKCLESLSRDLGGQHGPGRTALCPKTNPNRTTHESPPDVIRSTDSTMSRRRSRRFGYPRFRR